MDIFDNVHLFNKPLMFTAGIFYVMCGRRQERDIHDVCFGLCVLYVCGCVCMCGVFVIDSLDGPTVEQVSEYGTR